MMTKLIGALALALIAMPVTAQEVLTQPMRANVGAKVEGATRCARVEGGKIVDIQEIAPSDLAADDGCWPDAPHKGIEWLPAPKADVPAYDPATQVLEAPTVEIGKDVVTETYTVRDKTPAEIEAAKPPEDRFAKALEELSEEIAALRGRIEELEAKK